MKPISTTTCTARELIEAFAEGRFRGSMRLASRLWLKRHPEPTPAPIASTQQLPAQGFNGYDGDESKVTPFDGAPILPVQPEEEACAFMRAVNLARPDKGPPISSHQLAAQLEAQPPTDQEQDELDRSEFDEGRLDRQWLKG